jgi:hypothetical protein
MFFHYPTIQILTQLIFPYDSVFRSSILKKGKTSKILHRRNKTKRKIVERGQIDTLTHKYMTVHFPDLAQALQEHTWRR